MEEPIYLKSIAKQNNLYLSLSGITIDDLKVIIRTNLKQLTEYGSKFHVLECEKKTAPEDLQRLIDLLKEREYVYETPGSNIQQAFQYIAKEHKTIYLINKLKPNEFYKYIDSGKTSRVFIQFCCFNQDGVLFLQKKEKKESNNKKSTVSQSVASANRNNTLKTYTIKQTREPVPIAAISVQDNLATGDQIFNSSKKQFTIGEKVLDNNGAATYQIQNNSLCVKLFDKNSLNTFLEAKIKRMLQTPLTYQNVCWPLDIAYDTDGHFRGYFVSKSDGVPLHLSIFKKAGIEKYFPDWTKANLCTLTLTILRKIEYLHKNGVLMGCINPASIRVVNDKTVYFTDTDNYQIEGFPSFAYNTSFTPPELLRKKLYLTDLDSENFAVAELVFMLMMTGKSPYTSGYSKDPIADIEAMQFPYPNGKIHGKALMPSSWRFMWSHLSHLKDAFYTTFQKGEYRNAKGHRENVDFWIKKVYAFSKSLEKPQDPESLKLYPETFKRSEGETYYRCRFCGIEHPRFYFQNRFFDDFQICNTCLGKKSDVSFTCVNCGKTYYYTNETALFHKQMKQTDSEWKDQRHCRDCKKKTVVCKQCGKDVPYYEAQNGYCRECKKAGFGVQPRRTIHRRYDWQ